MQLLFCVSCYYVVIAWQINGWHIILSQFIFGVLCASIFACNHETVHRTAFKSVFLNRIAAAICGFECLYASTAFKELHFTHHRHTHEPGMDPEISFGRRPVPSVLRTLPTYLAWCTGLPFLMFKVFMILCGCFGMPEPIRQFAFPFIRRQVRMKLFLESILIALTYSTIIYLALFVNQGFWGLIVAQVTGHLMLSAYLAAEHNGLPYEETNILRKTRSMNCSKFMKTLMWNMTYHAEHHAYPAIPFHALPQLHELLKEEITNKDLSYA
ncbi:MAG: fatty acid desaturase, partial [Flavobacteriales bacterium]